MSKKPDISYVLHDHIGQPVADPIIEMQSEETLRQMIRMGHHVQACFTEIKRRNQRVRAGLRAINSPLRQKALETLGEEFVETIERNGIHL